MAYPVVEGEATSNDGDRSGTTLSMNVPAFVEAGDVLLAFVTEDGSTAAGNISFPAGWIEVFDDAGGSTVAAYCAVKWADGTESGTISVTVAGNSCCGVMYRVSGAANPNFEPPIADTRTRSGSVNTFHGRMVWGSQKRTNDFLSFCTAHTGETSKVISYYPDNYSNGANIQGTSCQMWYCHRDVRAPGEVGGEWGFNTSATGGVNSVVMLYPKTRWNNSTTYPYVRSMATTDDDGRFASTKFTMKLPQDIHPGDLLMAFISQDDVVSPAITWPNGWTELYDHDFVPITAPTAGVLGACAWKKAGGDEAANVELSVVGADRMCSVVVAIGGSADPDVSPPEISSPYEASIASANMPNLTPSGGSDDYLWIAVLHVDDVDDWPESFIPSFESRVSLHSNEDIGIVGVTTYLNWFQYTGSSLNPGELNYGSAETVVAYTIAVYPGSFDVENWWYLGRYDSGRGRYQ